MVVNEEGILRCLQLQTTVCSALCRIRANIHTTTIELVMFISQLEQLNFMQVFLVSVRVVTRMNGHSRFQCCNDRVAEEARYHKTCHDRFHLGKTTPLRYDKLRKSAARAADVKKQHSFSMMCNWLESQIGMCTA